MSKTVDELIGAYIEASNAVVWEADRLGHLPKTLDMQRAGIRAVVTALRDEMQVHCHTHGEPECCGRGVPNYNNTAEECCCAPNMKVTDEIVIGLFNEILAPREGGQAAGGSTSNAGTATEAGGARCATTCASAPAALAPTDFAAHLARQRVFSERTFGPGERVEGVSDHIRKELLEVAKAEPGNERQAEWIDVVMLALDGAWRSGMSPEQIIQGLRDKLEKNERRTWPDWRTADPNKAIEHDRAAPAPDVCEWTQEGWEYRTAGCRGWSYNIYSDRYAPKGNKCHLCGLPIKFTEAK